MKNRPDIPRYTCNDYREEMILLGLQKQLSDPGLPESEKDRVRAEIRRIEKQMGME